MWLFLFFFGFLVDRLEGVEEGDGEEHQHSSAASAWQPPLVWLGVKRRKMHTAVVEKRERKKNLLPSSSLRVNLADICAVVNENKTLLTGGGTRGGAGVSLAKGWACNMRLASSWGQRGKENKTEGNTNSERVQLEPSTTPTYVKGKKRGLRLYISWVKN